ncbi:hypothetical protein F5B22DRAFT_584113 [Xylaria bambusicola]|uniref:uncharacterized protein n=1 Tax=Xylaria bambusicola TaxID=326684 RepID=UPI0020088F5A|nr:uncharacterized protein F5B22DRAFT_584113 [Xylaria bambusicola]KAI0528196.1 hypothetical protein F5B22DRAFT_584113 [Xylaria bambusicola]
MQFIRALVSLVITSRIHGHTRVPRCLASRTDTSTYSTNAQHTALTQIQRYNTTCKRVYICLGNSRVRCSIALLSSVSFPAPCRFRMRIRVTPVPLITGPSQQ